MKFALKPLKFEMLSNNKIYARILGAGVYIEPKLDLDGAFYHYYICNGNVQIAKTLDEAKARCQELAIFAVRQCELFEEVN